MATDMGMTTLAEKVGKIKEALSFLVNSEIVQTERLSDR